MKIEVRNLGILKQVEIDIKPMTIFVGPNNSGKTLLAYVLLAIFGQDGWSRYTTALAEKEIQDVYPPLENVIQQVINEGSATIDVHQFANEYAEMYINNVARYARKWLKAFMNVERFSFEDLDINIHLADMKTSLLERVLSFGMDDGISVGQTRRRPLLSAVKKEGEALLYFYTAGKLESLPQNVINAFLIRHTFQAIHRGFYVNAHAFPTERTTFIPLLSRVRPPQVNTTSNITAIRTDEEARQEIAVSTIGPVTNFINTAFASLFKKASQRESEAEKTPLVTRYIQLAQLLEKEVLGGDVDYTSAELEALRELLFRPTEDVALEMGIVSSMVKELAPLVLYLRYVAQPKEWLIIDEPEMNLHPEAQVRLAELLAMLVNADLSVLFTTHSPYMIDHLVNLMKAAEYEDKTGIRDKFYLQREEAFIPKEDVAVYLFEHGIARSILEEDGLINWKTFSAVSDRINQIYFEL